VIGVDPAGKKKPKNQKAKKGLTFMRSFYILLLFYKVPL
jgi:hypothetical protein